MRSTDEIDDPRWSDIYDRDQRIAELEADLEANRALMNLSNRSNTRLVLQHIQRETQLSMSIVRLCSSYSTSTTSENRKTERYEK